MVNFKRFGAIGKVSAPVKQAGEHGRDKLKGVLRLEDNDIERTVTRLVFVRHRDVELNLREVDKQDAQSVALNGFAVEVQREVRLLRKRICNGRRQVGHRAEEPLCGFGSVHDGRVVAGSRHNAEAEFSTRNFDLSEVEVERAFFAYKLGEGMWFKRGSQIECEQIRRAGRKGKYWNARVCQKIAYGGHRAIAAACNNGVEFLCSVDQCFYAGGSIGAAYTNFVSVMSDGANEVVDGTFSKTGCEVIDNEQFHRFPFSCYDGMVQHGVTTAQGKERLVYIANQEQFVAFVQRAMHSNVLAIDTEFMREKTYYAKLCLIQLATDDEVAIVDPFALDDLGALAPVLQNEQVMKLFHAGRQDLEIILREVGVLPKPLFDTQVAAALLGHTQQIGYAALVHAECGVTLKKIDSFTDWSRRPLSESQLEYAADDVVYLPRMYERMRGQLMKLNRLSWLDPDFEELSNPAKYAINERERYRRLKRVSQLSRRQLAAAREVASWRELEAQRRDVPRKWVMTAEQIVDACKREARSIDELFMVRGMSERLSTRDARAVVSLITSALDAPPDTWPEPDRCGKNEPNVDAQLDLMCALVRLRAKENGVAFPTLASHDDLARVARGYREDIDLLKGWRRALVGEELLALLEGKLSLSLDGMQLRVERRD